MLYAAVNCLTSSPEIVTRWDSLDGIYHHYMPCYQDMVCRQIAPRGRV